MTNKTISGFISILAGKLGGLFLGLLITPILVRILGSGGYGDYAFLLSVFAILTTFAHAGVSAGIRKFIAEDREEEEWEDLVFAFYGQLGIGLAVVCALAISLFGLYGPVDRWFEDLSPLYFLLLGVMVLTNQLFYISRYTLMGLHLERKSEPLTVLQKILFGVIGLSLAYVGHDVAGVLVGTAIAWFCCAVIATWLLRNYVDIRRIFRRIPSAFPQGSLFRFNVFNTIFILLTISLYNVDLLLLRPLAGSHQTGLYKAALVIAELVWIVPQAVQIAFIHSSSELWSQGRLEEITEMVSKATRYTLLFTLLLVIGLAALASEFVPLYFGSEFADAAVPLLLLLPGVLGFAVARPIFAVGQGKGNLRLLILATGSASIVNLALNLLLIPRYGMNGAAVATSIGYGSMVIFHGIAARQLGYDPFTDIRLTKIFVTGLVTAPIIIGLAVFINSRLLSLLIVPPMGFVLFTLAALRTQAIGSQEVIQITDRVPQPLGKWASKVIAQV